MEKEEHHREMKYVGRLERGGCWDVLKGDKLFKIYYKAEQSKAHDKLQWNFTQEVGRVSKRS